MANISSGPVTCPAEQALRGLAPEPALESSGPVDAGNHNVETRRALVKEGEAKDEGASNCQVRASDSEVPLEEDEEYQPPPPSTPIPRECLLRAGFDEWCLHVECVRVRYFLWLWSLGLRSVP